MKQSVTRTTRLAEIDQLRNRIAAKEGRMVGRRQAVDIAVLQTLRQLEADLPLYQGLVEETDHSQADAEEAA